MASSVSSATKRISQRIAQMAGTKSKYSRKKSKSQTTGPTTPQMASTTGGEVRAKRQTSSEIRAKREAPRAKQATPAGVERQTSYAIKYDQDKVDFSLLTRAMLEPMTRALMYGERKYSRGNFRTGFENTRLTSAALRHIFAYLDREEHDPESGVSHLGHAMAALAMLLDNNAEGVSTDVRYKKADPTGPSW